VAGLDRRVCNAQDADFNSSIVDKNSAEFSDFFLGDEHVGADTEPGAGDVETVKEEIRESMYVVKLLGMFEGGSRPFGYLDVEPFTRNDRYCVGTRSSSV
jgi:hypothetical protein